MLIQFIDFGAEFCWIQQWMQVIFFEFPSFWMGRIYECLCYGNVSSGAFYAGNFRGWSGQLSISSSQQPPATHPATLRLAPASLWEHENEWEWLSLRMEGCVGIFRGIMTNPYRISSCWSPITGWWLGTCFIFPNIGNDHPNWLSYFSEGLKPPTR